MKIKSAAQTTFREVEKQTRAFERGGAVRVFGENGCFITRLNSSGDSQEIGRLLAAPNAEPVRTHTGKLVAIRLLPCGDDFGHSGERHGNSNITTTRCRTASGQYVGSDTNLKHKADRETAGTPTLGGLPQSVRGPVGPPLATK